MTTSGPWTAVPAEVATVLEPELPAISDAILRAIGEEVPEYARPLEGAFGHGVRTGVTGALRRFLALLSDPGSADPAAGRVYIALGRDEFRAGRTLDALQAAYRVGARVAWRRVAELSVEAGFDHHVITQLAEAIFAYIDELSAESVEGYARAQSEGAGERQRRQRELVEALLEGAPVQELADVAGWRLPRTAAALACPVEHLPGLARRLGADVVATAFERTGCIVVPDAEGPGRAAAIRLAVGERRAAVGPDLPLERLADSWRLAAGALALRADAADDGDAGGVVVADDHLADLLVTEGAGAAARISDRLLAPFADLTPKARERMEATALAYVQRRGSAPAMARALHIHPQTARYRIDRLRELLGDKLDDPQARFELEAALRWTAGAADAHPRRSGR